MNADPRPFVLLVSTAPLAHSRLAHDLILRGYRVRFAENSGALERELTHAPEYVFVDLVYPPRFRRQAVAHLNRREQGAVVYAIHDGDIERTRGPLNDLTVDAWCRRGECLGHSPRPASV